MVKFAGDAPTADSLPVENPPGQDPGPVPDPSPLSRPFAAPVTTATVSVSGGTDRTGATDVSSTLNTLISGAADGSIIDFPYAAGIYRLDDGLHFYGKNHIYLRGNSQTTLVMHGTDSETFSTFHLRGSNHIAIDGFTVQGAYSTARGAGTWPGQAGESSHCLGLSGYFGGRESSYVEMSNVTADHFYGDFVYIEGENVSAQRPSHHIWVHDCAFDYVGRNAVSPINVTDVIIEANSFDHMAYHCFDCEPNQDAEELRRIWFRDNTVGIFAARASLVGQFFNCYSPNDAPITDITVSGNTVSGIASDGVNGLPRCLHTAIMGETAHRYQSIAFTNNTGTRTVAGSGVIYAQHTDLLTITGNTQPLSSGTLVQTVDCTTDVTSPNPNEPVTGYFIAPTGNDSTGTGTLANPWKSVNKFATVAAAGDTLYCRGGTYTATTVTVVDTTPSGTSGHPITVRNYPSETPVFVGSTPPTTSQFLKLTGGVSYWTVDGLTFQSFKPGSTGVIWIGDKDTDFNGVPDGNSTHHHVVRSCSFTATAGGTTSEQQVYLSWLADDCTVEYNTFVGAQVGGDGGTAVNIGDHEPGPERFLVQRNIMSHFGDTGAIWVNSANTYGSILHNTFDNSAGTSVTFIRLPEYALPLVIRDNAGTNGTNGIMHEIFDEGSGLATLDHNFWGQTFDANHLLVAGQSGRSAASDGTDAGALDW